MKYRRPQDPLPHLPRPSDWDVVQWSSFTRTQIGEMFGNIDRSIISKDCTILGFNQWREIPRSEIWRIYILKCWQRLNPNCWRQRFIEEVKELGDEKFVAKYVTAQGGSREDCEAMIDNYIAKQMTKKLIA